MGQLVFLLKSYVITRSSGFVDGCEPTSGTMEMWRNGEVVDDEEVIVEE